MELVSRDITVGERKFLIQLMRFSNGCFIAITEGGEPKLGSLDLSIRTRERVNSSTILPSKLPGVFPAILGEMTANLINGLSLISVYVGRELSPEAAKTLLSEVRGMLTAIANPSREHQ